jgi:hypothetical protein
MKPELLVLIALLVLAALLYAAPSAAQASAPTYVPSPSSPVALPEPDVPQKCGYWIEPSAITGVNSRSYVCCHRQSAGGAGAQVGGAIGATAGKLIPVPFLGSVVGGIFGSGIGSVFTPGGCAD